MMMDIQLIEGGDAPRAPSDVRFRRAAAEPYADRQRVKLTYELTPFFRRPNVDIRLEGPPGTVLGSVTIIETMDSRFSLTAHLRAAPPAAGHFEIISILGYVDRPQVDRDVTPPVDLPALARQSLETPSIRLSPPILQRGLPG
jgi:hypothetical protein